MKGTLNIKVDVDSKEVGAKLTELLQNMTNTVSEKDLLILHKQIKLDKNFFKKVVKKMNTPFIQNMLKK
jgi:hypothetical protein